MKNKFNIGDKVTIKNESPGKPIVFEISEVIISKTYVLYTYFDDRFTLGKKYYDERDLEIYTEPKPKVKKYLWAYKDGYGNYTTSKCFYKDEQQFKKAVDAVLFLRLDWSMIEVE